MRLSAHHNSGARSDARKQYRNRRNWATVNLGEQKFTSLLNNRQEQLFLDAMDALKSRKHKQAPKKPIKNAKTVIFALRAL